VYITLLNHYSHSFTSRTFLVRVEVFFEKVLSLDLRAQVGVSPQKGVDFFRVQASSLEAALLGPALPRRLWKRKAVFNG